MKEIKRCKECPRYGRLSKEQLNNDEQTFGLDASKYCDLLKCEFPPDGFCSYGQLKYKEDTYGQK